MYVCVCVFIYVCKIGLIGLCMVFFTAHHTQFWKRTCIALHTLPHAVAYEYVYVCVCLCEYVCVFVCLSARTITRLAVCHLRFPIVLSLYIRHYDDTYKKKTLTPYGIGLYVVG